MDSDDHKRDKLIYEIYGLKDYWPDNFFNLIRSGAFSPASDKEKSQNQEYSQAQKNQDS